MSARAGRGSTSARRRRRWTGRWRRAISAAATAPTVCPPTRRTPPSRSPATCRHRCVSTRSITKGEPALRLIGTIAPGDGTRIAETLARREALPPILLHSPGGSVTDAFDIGRFLRDASASVSVVAGDVCLSACPYLLAGGAERRVGQDASIGVHQHYFGQNSVEPAFMAVEDIQRGQGFVMEYLVEMGVDPRLMQPALMTPPGEIYILVPDELGEYGLVTAPGTA